MWGVSGGYLSVTFQLLVIQRSPMTPHMLLISLFNYKLNKSVYIDCVC